ncbi:MAG: beta-1,3-glucanase family protein [Fibrobacterales bacterium]
MNVRIHILLILFTLLVLGCSNNAGPDDESSSENISSSEVLSLSGGGTGDVDSEAGASSETDTVAGESSASTGGESSEIASGESSGSTEGSSGGSSIEGAGESSVVGVSSSEGPKEELVEPADFDDAVVQGYLKDDKLPLLFANNSRYSDDEIFIAIVADNAPGLHSAPVWYDIAHQTVRLISASDNTVESPVETDSWKYPEIFTKLSDIPDNTIAMPRLTSAKMFISFKKMMYIHFHDAGGYAGPSHSNLSDPNHGIRYETIEFNTSGYIGSTKTAYDQEDGVTYNGVWINTSRVDAYQYPMGVEVFGTDVGGVGNDYKKVGELLEHDEILNRWNNTVSDPFKECYNEHKLPAGDGIIYQPSKIPEFGVAGEYKNYFDPYIDEVWTAFRSKKVRFSMFDEGLWEGWVEGDVFMAKQIEKKNGQPGDASGSIASKPSTTDVIEGAGVMAAGGMYDKNVQKFVCASLNRGIVNPDAPDGEFQDWEAADEFFKRDIYNEYVGFFHNPEISYNSETYAFAYDDVYDLSSTIQATFPDKIRVTIGGFVGIK